MPSTPMPSRRATTACPTSWASSDAKNSTAPVAPTIQYEPLDWPGTSIGSRFLARLTA